MLELSQCIDGFHTFIVTKWMKANATNSAKEFVCSICLAKVHMDEVLRLESDRKKAGKVCIGTASPNQAS